MGNEGRWVHGDVLAGGGAPSPVSATGARLPTSALCRPCTNSRGPLIGCIPSSLGLKCCSPFPEHDQCSA